MIIKKHFKVFLKRHNLTEEILAEVADVQVETINAYVDGTLTDKIQRKLIARAMYVIMKNNICMPVIDGYYKLLCDVFPEDFKIDPVKRSHISAFKNIFYQCYEDEFGE